MSFVDDLLVPKIEDTIVIRQSNYVIFMHDGTPFHKSPETAEVLAEELAVMKISGKPSKLNSAN